MINHETIEFEEVFTEGFDLSVAPPLEITIGAGTFTHIIQGNQVDHSSEEISFDIEPDPDLTVDYRVYVMEGGGLEVESTVRTLENYPVYQGEGTILHILTLIEVPPAAKSTEECTITTRNITQKIVEEVPENEDTTTEE